MIIAQARHPLFCSPYNLMHSFAARRFGRGLLFFWLCPYPISRCHVRAQSDTGRQRPEPRHLYGDVLQQRMARRLCWALAVITIASNGQRVRQHHYRRSRKRTSSTARVVPTRCKGWRATTTIKSITRQTKLLKQSAPALSLSVLETKSALAVRRGTRRFPADVNPHPALLQPEATSPKAALVPYSPIGNMKKIASPVN